MRLFLRLTLGLLLIVSGTATAREHREQAAAVAARLADPRPLVIAHRGCWRQTAENSLAAIAACAELGVDMVEIDLRQTKDGVIVLLHDDSLERTTSLSGPLREKNHAELRSARLRRQAGGPDSALTDQHLPSFEETLAAPVDVFFFLDIKEPIHEQVARLLDKHDAWDRVLFSMNKEFGPELMQARFVGRAAVMPKLSENFGGKCVRGLDPGSDLIAYAKLHALIYEVVFCDDKFFNLARAHAQGARLWVNALGPRFAGGRDEATAVANPDAVWGELLAHGASALQTDHPRELIAYLRKTGRW
jgi:glycerophosphoryl diester phosphodiesterase